MPRHRGESDVLDASGPAAPARRAALAHARAEELRRRRAELSGGVPVTADVVEIARHRADQAVERALCAWQAALDRHALAQTAHLRAAAAHEQAAMTAGDGDCDVHQTAAERHRAAATLHEATIRRLTSERARAASSGDFLGQQ